MTTRDETTQPAAQKRAQPPWAARVWYGGRLYWERRFDEPWKAQDALTAVRNNAYFPEGTHVTLDYEP